MHNLGETVVGDRPWRYPYDKDCADRRGHNLDNEDMVGFDVDYVPAGPVGTQKLTENKPEPGLSHGIEF